MSPGQIRRSQSGLPSSQRLKESYTDFDRLVNLCGLYSDDDLGWRLLEELNRKTRHIFKSCSGRITEFNSLGTIMDALTMADDFERNPLSIQTGQWDRKDKRIESSNNEEDCLRKYSSTGARIVTVLMNFREEHKYWCKN